MFPFVVAVLTFALFARTMGYDFVGWDDADHILRNPAFNPPGFKSILALWTAPYFYLYIPMTYTVWGMLVAVAGLKPFSFHALNVLTHALNAALLFICIDRTLPSPSGDSLRAARRRHWAAALGAALFAVHPIQVESVAWISSFKELLATTFCLLAWKSFLRHREARGKWPLRAFGGFLLLAVLAKPTAAMLPAFLIVIGRFFLGGTWRSEARRLLPWMLLGIPSLLIASHAQESAWILERPPLWQRPFIAGDAVAFYLSKLFLPRDLALDYGRIPSIAFSDGAAYLTSAFVAGVAAACVWLHRRRNLGVPLAAFLLLTLPLAPVLGFATFGYQTFSTVADHYLYFSLAGLGLALAEVLRASTLNPRALFASVFLVAAALSVQTFAQLPHWESGTAQASHSLSVNPRSFTSLQYLAADLIQSDRAEQAIPLLRKALEIRPSAVSARHGLGLALMVTRRYDEAIRHFEWALKDLPRKPSPLITYMRMNFGNALAEVGRTSDGLQVLEEAARIDPGSSDVRQSVAALRQRLAERTQPGAPRR